MNQLKSKTSNPRGMKQLYALGTKTKFDLSLSENPLGCSSRAKKALMSLAFNLSDYPAPNGKLLKAAIAKKFGMEPQNVFVANGSESIVTSIPRIFGKSGKGLVVPTLTFPMMTIAAELSGMEVVRTPMTDDLGIDLQRMRTQISSNTGIIYLCNPNNPTGSVLSPNEVLSFLRAIPKKVIVVMDEAGIGFGGESVIPNILSFPNLIVLRTFSKAFGLADLRVGFAISNQNLILKMEESSQPFPISSISEKVAAEALKDDRFIFRTKTFVDAERLLMSTDLQKLGFTVFPSSTNNLFVRLPGALSSEVFWKKLAAERISLVKGSSFAGFGDDYFRVSIRNKGTNSKFIEVVQKLANQLQ